jgi:hypothetical protein
MNENRVIALRQKGAIDDPLTEILRVGARLQLRCGRSETFRLFAMRR